MSSPIQYGYVVSGGGGSGTDATKVPLYTTQSKTANFSAAAGFLYLVDSTSGAVTVTLPAANSAGQQFAVKWTAGANVVTLQRAGSDTIGDVATTATLALAMEVWEFVSSGAGQWNLIAGNKSLASLDGRYPAKYGFAPPDHGLKAWSMTPDAAIGGTAPVSGTLQLARVHLPAAATVTNVVLHVVTGGTGLTASQCIAGVWASAGAKVDVTGDQSGTWNSTGNKTMALTAGAATYAAGDYYVGWWAVTATTTPAFARQGTTSLINVGLVAPDFRFATANTGLTTAATAPSNLGTQTAAVTGWWAALS